MPKSFLVPPEDTFIPFRCHKLSLITPITRLSDHFNDTMHLSRALVFSSYLFQRPLPCHSHLLPTLSSNLPLINLPFLGLVAPPRLIDRHC
ncbi:unnamed protein product [Caenorhabditis nigoni]